MSCIGTQQVRRHKWYHWDASNAATKNMTQDANVKPVHKTASSTNLKQDAVGYEYIHTAVNARQITIYHAVGVSKELHNQFIAAHSGKPPWLTKALVWTVREIKQ
jgi:hypothetical protein